MDILPEWAIQMNRLGKDGIPFLFILDFETKDPVVIPLSEVSSECIRFEITPPNLLIPRKQRQPHTFALDILPVASSEYAKGFERVMEAIHAGDTYLLNLCYATQLSGLPSLEYIFENAVAPFKLLFQNRFVVFSPEEFVRIENGCISTFPMKGTIDGSIPNAADRLLADIKEQEEHATVVDLLRNDLSIVSKEVTVNRYRYITKVQTAKKTLLQCSSEISGKLEGDYWQRVGSIFRALLPAGSVTGAPKKRTVSLIHEIELEPRRYYTGVFGVFDGQKLESAVMIRMIEQRENGFFYRSGGGITYQSDMEQEYQEMIDKVYIPV